MSGDGADPRIQWKEAKLWFAKSLEDIHVTLILLEADPPLLNPAAYHCQQAAEKALKGLLIVAAQSVPKSHDLERLASLTSPFYPALTTHIAAIDGVTLWGTTTRYPDVDADRDPAIDDIREVATAVGGLLDAIAALDPTAP